MQEDQDQNQKRNMMIFFVILLAVMLGQSHITKLFSPEQVKPGSQNVTMVPYTSINYGKETTSPAVEVKEEPVRPQAEVKTIQIKAPRVSGTISTKGLKFHDINLNNYTQRYDNDVKVSVFGKDNYFAMSGWGSDDKSLILPDENSCWETESTELTPNSPIVLTWNNGKGLVFTKKISIDDNFVFTIVDDVKNQGNEPVRIKNVSLIYRERKEDKSESMGFYHGPIGYFNKDLHEVDYSDIEKKKEISYQSKGGWFGITDKYWLVSFIPEQNSSYSASYKFINTDTYAVDLA